METSFFVLLYNKIFNKEEIVGTIFILLIKYFIDKLIE